MSNSQKRKHRSTKEKLRVIAKNVVDRLSKEGFVVHQKETDYSIYLKIDYGVLGVMRISNHDSKQGLVCRYNMRIDKNWYHVNTFPNNPGFVEEFFTINQLGLDTLVMRLLSNRRQKILHLGSREAYYFLMGKACSRLSETKTYIRVDNFVNACKDCIRKRKSKLKKKYDRKTKKKGQKRKENC